MLEIWQDGMAIIIAVDSNESLVARFIFDGLMSLYILCAKNLSFIAQ